jgi:hypothetical protein
MEDAPSTSVAPSDSINVASTPQAEAPNIKSLIAQQGDNALVAITLEEPPLKKVRLNDDPVPQPTFASATEDTAIHTTEQPIADEDVAPTAIKRTRFDEDEIAPSPKQGEPAAKKSRIEEPPTAEETFPMADAPTITFLDSTTRSDPSQPLVDAPKDEGGQL